MPPRPRLRFSDVLRLTRLPLAITAISNTQAALVLRHVHGQGHDWSWPAALSLALMSLGLFAFGMIANDIVDYHRDMVLAPSRPLPAGRVSMQQAYLLAAGLLLLGIGSGLVYALFFQGGSLIAAFMSILFLTWTLLLIFFYNLAGKFVGGVGILTLGLVRFFHAAIPQPGLPVIWHALLIMDHVVILAAICYALQGKRPRLEPVHRWGAGLGLLAFNVVFVGALLLARAWRVGSFQGAAEALNISIALVYPLLAAIVFAAFAAAMLLSLRAGDESRRQRFDLRRRTGRRLMIFGLLWLVIYDLAFVYGYLREF